MSVACRGVRRPGTGIESRAYPLNSTSSTPFTHVCVTAGCHAWCFRQNEKLNQHALHGVEERDIGRYLSTQRESKLSLLDTQYNDSSRQLTACQQDPLFETMRSKVDSRMSSSQIIGNITHPTITMVTAITTIITVITMVITITCMVTITE